jgi:hypothetical protein
MDMSDSDYEEENDPPFKRICARYGLAMYFVQVLEHGIVNALVWLDLYKKTGGRWTAEEFDRYNESRFGDTLKELSKRLATFGAIPDELKADLDEANRRRRLLAHHFFRDAVDAMAADEIAEVLARLEDDRRFFKATDVMLDDFMEPLLERIGFTQDVRDRAMNDYFEELANKGRV